MSGWEYKVVPAPTKGLKGKGIKGPEQRFSHALEALMNEMGAEGWEFQRSETLPSIERSGLTGTTKEWRNVMVFRRVLKAPMDAFEPELLPAPEPVAEPTAVVAELVVEPTPVAAEPADIAADTIMDDAPPEPASEIENDAADDGFVPGPGATRMLPDNGVEETSDVAGMTASLRSLVAQRKVKDSTH